MMDHLESFSDAAYANLQDDADMVPPLVKLKVRLEGHLALLPVIGFNSGKYDINTLKEFLMPILGHESKLKFVIKKTNNFMCVSTDRLRFLDVLNFLAPGFSYDAFRKAYDCTFTKGFFPYECQGDTTNRVMARPWRS